MIYFISLRQAASPTSSRKDKTSSPSHSRRSTPSAKSSGRTKGVPQNFGYIKRTNGSSAATEMQTNAMLAGGRTVVPAMPRSGKLKVSGGTQTDFQQSKFNAICHRSRTHAVINDFHVTVCDFFIFILQSKCSRVHSIEAFR